jgi:hypothetical protein
MQYAAEENSPAASNWPVWAIHLLEHRTGRNFYSPPSMRVFVLASVWGGSYSNDFQTIGLRR